MPNLISINFKKCCDDESRPYVWTWFCFFTIDVGIEKIWALYAQIKMVWIVPKTIFNSSEFVSFWNFIWAMHSQIEIKIFPYRWTICSFYFLKQYSQNNFNFEFSVHVILNSWTIVSYGENFSWIDCRFSLFKRPLFFKFSMFLRNRCYLLYFWIIY